MLHRYKSLEDDRILSIRIKLENIKEHMKLITSMVENLEKEIRRKKINVTTSEIINSKNLLLNEEEQEILFNTTGSLDFSNPNL